MPGMAWHDALDLRPAVLDASRILSIEVNDSIGRGGACYRGLFLFHRGLDLAGTEIGPWAHWFNRVCGPAVDVRKGG